MNTTQSSQTPKLVGAIVMTAVVLVGIYFLILNNKPAATSASSASTDLSSDDSATTTTPTPSSEVLSDTSTTQSDSATTSTGTSSTFKDGTYTASADYSVPRDTNTIKVSLTVKDDVITAVEAKYSYGDRESTRYINSFDSAISGAVVGKKLDAAQLSRLSGASETTQGFDDALTTIISQAKA
jgi:uncharacterized protein with FMN-binding domain